MNQPPKKVGPVNKLLQLGSVSLRITENLQLNNLSLIMKTMAVVQQMKLKLNNARGNK